MGFVFDPCFVLSVLSNFATVSQRERELVALIVLLSSFGVLCLFQAVPQIGLWSRIVAISVHKCFWLHLVC